MKKLETLIDQLSVTSQKSKDEIVQELTTFANFKFGTPISDKEGAIIKNIQEKLITGLYRMTDHSYVTRRPDLKGKFNIDALEMDYLERAANELGELGILEGTESYTRLTKPGILRAKEILGEI